jgi:hypothetical protein
MVPTGNGGNLGNCPLDLLTGFVVVKSQIVPDSSYDPIDESMVCATLKPGFQLAE